MSLYNIIIKKVNHIFHPTVGEIWMLHRVVEKKSEPRDQEALEISTMQLESLIEEYRRNGYSFVSIDDIFNEIQSKSLRKCKKICITFDDGYRDNYELAYPLLKRLDVPFTIYITLDMIDNIKEMWWYPGQKLGMTSSQLISLAAEPLCTIGAHTLSHPKLDTLSSSEQEKEIMGSKSVLEEIIEKEVRHFSYPYGAHNQTSIECVRKTGFLSAVQSWGGASRRGDKYFELHRKEI